MPRIFGNPLTAFFTLAYAISWLFWGANIALGGSAQALITVGAFGPFLAALLVTAASEGRGGVRAFLRRLLRWRSRWWLYALALGGPALLALGAALLDMAAGGPVPNFARQVPEGYPLYVAIPLLVPIFLFGLLFGGPLGEEPGWRGFALPILLARLHPVVASAILGVVWGLWHAPLFLIAGTTQARIPFGSFVLWTIGLSYLFARLHALSGGGVTLAITFHAAINLSAALLVLPTADFPAVRPFIFHLALVWLACIALAATAHRAGDAVRSPAGTKAAPAPGDGIDRREGEV